MAAVNRKVALAIFGILALAGPLLFGASDRIFQIALTFILGLGMLAAPPCFPKTKGIAHWAILLFIIAVVGMEFLPAAWFGSENWRTVLTRDYQIALPPTHNPEPARALDVILTIAVAGAFFVWTRSLAQDHRNRLALAWTLFLAAAIFALVCLLLGTRTDWMIYGWRYTPGWTGYGPFPNRNHTAALLAMGALAGCGCTARAARRKKHLFFIAGLLLIAIIFVALLESRSRGGLIGFLVGLLVFGILAVAKKPTLAAVGTAFATLFVSTGLLFAFGSDLLARFNNPADGNLPTNIRWHIWQDTIAMWKIAPLCGFGLDTFTQVFQFFATVRLDDAIVLHPESSWLLWLVELGALPVAIATIALIYFLGKKFARTFFQRRWIFRSRRRIRGICCAALPFDLRCARASLGDCRIWPGTACHRVSVARADRTAAAREERMFSSICHRRFLADADPDGRARVVAGFARQNVTRERDDADACLDR